jgi:hypothetical protein
MKNRDRQIIRMASPALVAAAGARALMRFLEFVRRTL